MLEKTVHNKLSSRPLVSSEWNLISIFAWIGAGWLLFIGWVWTRWILSDQFRPVDPGPDPLPSWQYWTLTSVQILGIFAALYLLWRFTIKPKINTGRFTTEGLVCLALPTVYFQDPLMNYTQNWFAYNAHLWNMGVWVGDKVFPTWIAPYGDRFLDPLVTFYGYIFWMLSAMLVICWFMRKLRTHFPQITQAALLFYGLIFTFFLDLAIEWTAIRIGWYAMPGAWRAVSLHAGTPYQVSLVTIFFGAVQTFAYALILFYKDDRGHSFVEQGVEKLKVSERGRTFIRFLALAGALHLFFFFTWPVLTQFQALHTDKWVDNMPSYFTTQCPEYLTNRECCGGPGIPIPRAEHNWLPSKTKQDRP